MFRRVATTDNLPLIMSSIQSFHPAQYNLKYHMYPSQIPLWGILKVGGSISDLGITTFIPLESDNEEPVGPVGVAAYASEGVNAVVHPISSDEEEPMEEVYEEETQEEAMSSENVQSEAGHLPSMSRWSFDHTICTTQTCYEETGPTPDMTQDQTRGYLDSYLEMEGLMINDVPANDTSDSDYIPPGVVNKPEVVRKTARKHGWFSGRFCDAYIS